MSRFLSHAQYDVSFSHYFDMEPSFNAASVGKQPKLNVSAAYAIDLAGFKHNPQTMYAGRRHALHIPQDHARSRTPVYERQDRSVPRTSDSPCSTAVKMKLFGGQLLHRRLGRNAQREL